MHYAECSCRHTVQFWKVGTSRWLGRQSWRGIVILSCRVGRVRITFTTRVSRISRNRAVQLRTYCYRSLPLSIHWCLVSKTNSSAATVGFCAPRLSEGLRVNLIWEFLTSSCGATWRKEYLKPAAHLKRT